MLGTLICRVKNNTYIKLIIRLDTEMPTCQHNSQHGRNCQNTQHHRKKWSETSCRSVGVNSAP